MKNYYCLNPGEFFVAQEIIKECDDIELYFPLKDTGVDLLAINPRTSKIVRIQVKESRTYKKGHSWHQLRKTKLNTADVFVFVSYIREHDSGRIRFRHEYIVVPQRDLREICERDKKADSNGKYAFYFSFSDGRASDLRAKKPIDFSKYHRAWSYVE